MVKLELHIDGDREDSVAVKSSSANPSVYEFTGIGVDVNKDETVVIELIADVDGTGSAQVKTALFGVEESGIANTAASDIADAPLVTVVAAVPVVSVTDVDTSIDEFGEDNVALFAYKVKAEGGDIKLGKTTFDIDVTSGVTLSDVEVRVYDNADQSGSEEFDSTGTTTAERAADAILATITGDATKSIDLSSVTVDENDTYYIFLIADITANADGGVVKVEVSDETFSNNVRGFNFTDVDEDTNGDQPLDGALLIEDDMESRINVQSNN